MSTVTGFDLASLFAQHLSRRQLFLELSPRCFQRPLRALSSLRVKGVLARFRDDQQLQEQCCEANGESGIGIHVPLIDLLHQLYPEDTKESFASEIACSVTSRVL
jgi:hypothetical protein